MKNKNMILMVVAIGIGLGAAFLTSQIGARTTAPDTVKILVAKKELPVGTMLTEKKMNDLVGVAEFPKGSLPPEVITDIALLRGKQLTRTLRTGDRFMPKDIGKGQDVSVPKGMLMYTLKMDPVKAVAGFALPGSHVDLILTEQKSDNKTQSSVMARDMLVVAVDITDVRPEGNKHAIPQLNSVSLAVTPQQGQMLALAMKRGEITLMLRDPESTDKELLPPIDRLPHDKVTNSAPNVEATKTVKILVAKVEVESGKKITSGNVDELFTEREVLDPAPATAVRSKEEVLGKVLTRTIDADQFVPVSILSDKEPVREAPEAVVEKPKPLRHELTITNGSSTNRHLYEAQNGKFRMVNNAPGGSNPATEDAPAINAPQPRIRIESLPPMEPKQQPKIVPLDVEAPGNDANF